MRYRAEIKQKACRLFASGYPRQEIADILRVPVSTIGYWTKETQKTKQVCAHCGKRFEPRRSDQQYCGHRCQANSGYKRRRGYIGARNCIYCASRISAESNRSKKFCSPRCRQRYHSDQGRGVDNPVERQQKRDQILPTILASYMGLSAREILNKVGLPDTVANRRYLRRKVDGCPEIEKCGDNKNRTYRRKLSTNQEPTGSDAASVSSLPVEGTPQSPLPTDEPVRTVQDEIHDLSERAKESRAIIDQDTLDLLIEEIPADLSKFVMTDEIKACFRVSVDHCLITASYFEPEGVAPVIARVISALVKKGLSPAWEFDGDLVFIRNQKDPEETALPVREIMLKEGGDRSIRLRRGKAWGLNDWRLNPHLYKHHVLPGGWDESWWTG